MNNFNQLSKLTKTIQKNIDDLNKLVACLNIEVELKMIIKKDDSENIVKQVLDEILDKIVPKNTTKKIIEVDKEEIDIDEIIEESEKNGVKIWNCIPCNKEGKKSSLKKHLSSKTHIVKVRKFYE